MQLTTSASFHRIDVFRISGCRSIFSHRCECWIRIRRWSVGGCELATHVLFLFCCCSTHVIIYKLNIRLHTQLSLDSQPVQTISKRQENKRSSVPSLRNASRPTKQLTSFTPLLSSHSSIMMTIVNHDQINFISHRQRPIKSLLDVRLVQRKMAPNRDQRFTPRSRRNRATPNKMKRIFEHRWISS